jgi:hypothetical protein
MSIAQTDRIDILFRDDAGHGVLVIADHLDWEEFDEGDHLLLLQEKMNTYLAFVDSGQLVKARPDWKDLSIVIQVDAMYAPNTTALEFYRTAGKAVAEAGLSLVLHEPDKGTTTRF